MTKILDRDKYMNTLRKILKDILKDVDKNKLKYKPDDIAIGIRVVEEIVEAHMNDIIECDNCGIRSRRKWYQIGYNDGFEAQPEKWIPVSSGKLPPDGEDVFITYQDKDDSDKRYIAITSYKERFFGGISIGKQWIPPFEYFYSNYEVVAWMPMFDEYKGE